MPGPSLHVLRAAGLSVSAAGVSTAAAMSTAAGPSTTTAVSATTGPSSATGSSTAAGPYCGSATVISSASVGPATVSTPTGGYEATITPAVGIAPVIPRANAEEDAVVKVVWPVKALMDAGVGGVVVVAVGTGGWRTTDADDDLRVGGWYGGPDEEGGEAAEQSFQDAH
jgi:hypothetical protein